MLSFRVLQRTIVNELLKYSRWIFRCKRHLFGAW